jgi:hypothetical protein
MLKRPGRFFEPVDKEAKWLFSTLMPKADDFFTGWEKETESYPIAEV